MKLLKILFSRIVIVIFTTTALLLGVLHENTLLQGPELKIYDMLIRAISPADVSRVVVVGIDEKSRRIFDQEPPPRSVIANAVKTVSAADPAAIGLQMLLMKKLAPPGLQELRTLEASFKGEKKTEGVGVSVQSAQWLADTISRLEQDDALITAVKSARNFILPFEFFAMPREELAKGYRPLSGLMRINSFKSKNVDGVDDGTLKATMRRYLYSGTMRNPSYTDLHETYAELAGKAGGLGHINLTADPDGTVRRLPLLISYRKRCFPSLALQLFAKFNGTRVRRLARDAMGGVGGVSIGPDMVPLDDNFNFRIRYRRPADAIVQVSMVDLLEQNIALDVFKNKIVLIGPVSGSGAGNHRTSLGVNMSPVQITAHAVDTLVSEHYLFRPFWARLLEMAVLLYFGLLLLFVIPKVSLKLGGVILGVFMFTWVGVVLLLFKIMGLWLWVLPPVYLAVGGFIFTSVWIRMTRLHKETIALNQSLGSIYQSQGLLDMAFDQYKKCPAGNREIKRLIYDLGLEYERKRMVNKALAVYGYLRKSGRYEDLDHRLENLRSTGTMIITKGSEKPIGTLALDDSAVLPTFGRYKIVKELGQGAMGAVYLGKDPKIKRHVAIKTLAYNAVDPTEIETVKTRFFHEAETAGRLSHPNIVTIYDIGEEHDMAYMAMELLDGEDLSFFCQDGHRLALNLVLDAMLKVARALAYAHQNGVVHRDIKPANIMRLKDGEVKVTDFGIARIMDKSKTRTGIVLGTPSYMSPEQVAGKKVDGRSDLFSLGVVFYELLSGEKPFAGENLTALMYAVTKGKYKPLSQLLPDLDPACMDIVHKLMSKALTRRYSSAKAVARDIEACATRLGFSGD